MPTLDFKGKQYIYSHHHSVPFRELEVDEKKSLPPKGKKAGLDDNLIIHGDNLHALKALMPQYAGKIKCIYIDPPYNTGNEGWCYNDNVNSPLMKEWLDKNANPVDKEDLQRHDKWLCMMWPRLKLLHELLADDGVIFISIDDNEYHHLHCIMDEIYGSDNCIGTMIWEGGRRNDSKQISTSHEYILAYAKNLERHVQSIGEWRERKNGIDDIYKTYAKLKRGLQPDWEAISKGLQKWYSELPASHPAKEHSHYRYADETGVYFASDLSGPDDGRKSRPNYDVQHPITGKNVPTPARGWRWEEPRMREELKSGRVHFGSDESTIPNAKVYLHENEYAVPSSVFYKDRRAASGLLKTIMGGKVFDFPKDVTVISRLINLVCNKNDVILDSFGGSGTTAHAVLDLNKDDGGNRKFILVEMEDYADKTTADRVRRVINGVPTAKDVKLKNGLGGSFTFCSLGKEISIEKIITGESLPDYGSLAKYVFYTATGHSLDGTPKDRLDFFVGETDLYEVFLIYKPDVAFLRGNESALNDTKLKAIAARGGKKEKLVFATAKYMGQKDLSSLNITFCQLPYAIHKVVGA